MLGTGFGYSEACIGYITIIEVHEEVIKPEPSTFMVNAFTYNTEYAVTDSHEYAVTDSHVCAVSDFLFYTGCP